MEGYCITCKKIVPMKEVLAKVLRNMQKIFEGKCEICNTVIYKKREN